MAIGRLFFSESRRTLVLAVPIIAGQVSQMLMGVVDSVMVGRVGVVPLAASAFANSLLSVPMLFGIGLIQAVSVRVSEAHGAGERKETGEVLRHGMAITAGAGLLLAALMVLLLPWLGHFGQSAEVAAEARGFLLLVGLSLLPMLLAMSLKQFSESLNHPWPPMFILLGSVALNALLNWILIYGHLGAPALGLTGAGWATLLSRIAALGAVLIYVLRATRFAGSLPMGWLRPLRWAPCVSLLRIGLPAATQLLLEVSAFSLAAIMMGWLGANALAAHQIALSCASTTFMFPLGISMATTIRIGQALGANEVRRVRAIGMSSFALGFLIMGCASIVLVFGRHAIARAFVEDPAVAAIAARLLLIASIFQIFDGLQVVGAGALRGLSDATFPMATCLVAYWIVFLPLAYFGAFPLGFAASGIWSALAVALGIVALTLLARFLAKSRHDA